MNAVNQRSVYSLEQWKLAKLFKIGHTKTYVALVGSSSVRQKNAMNPNISRMMTKLPIEQPADCKWLCFIHKQPCGELLYDCNH